ncbi:MAG: phosphatase PAP2 family protein [Parcubacteria group bacterium]|nr:phosphatase PAP2 family protein [Parcubacteria group bacterium]
MLGEWEFLLALVIIISGYWFCVKKKRDAMVFILLFLGASILVWALKELFGRPRPSFLGGDEGYSFPSGHAAMSLVVYGWLAVYWARRNASGWAKIAVITGAALLILLIGLSRVYLNMHYMSDVIGGYVVGGVILTIGIYFANRRVHS